MPEAGLEPDTRIMIDGPFVRNDPFTAVFVPLALATYAIDATRQRVRLSRSERSADPAVAVNAAVTPAVDHLRGIADPSSHLRSRVRRFESCRGHFIGTIVIIPLACRSARLQEPDPVSLGPAPCRFCAQIASEQRVSRK
jgi:hypothetical protein